MLEPLMDLGLFREKPCVLLALGFFVHDLEGYNVLGLLDPLGLYDHAEAALAQVFHKDVLLFECIRVKEVKELHDLVFFLCCHFSVFLQLKI